MAPLSTVDFEMSNMQDVRSAEHSYCTMPAKAPLTRNVRPRKSVSFHPSVSVRKTIHINNYTDDEIDACWYNDKERQDIRGDIHFVVNLISNDLLRQDTEEYSRRGIDCRTRENVARRQKLRSLAWYSVFEEQDTQFDVGIFEPECIAYAYNATSAAASEIARSTALKDELDASM